MRAITGLWRRRRGPLHRGVGRAEGRLALAAVLLIVLAVPAAAGWGGRAAHEALAETAREQHRERLQVWATVDPSVARPVPGDGPEAGHPVAVTWTAPDGRAHAGTVTADRAAGPGERLRIWIDSRGRPTTGPMDPTAVATHTVLAGIGAGGAAAGAVELLRRLALRRLRARRLARWDEEWARTDPGRGCAGHAG
ncbi:hypothetical protein V1L54_15445 [Streptomyces sp. TRM 70361]|uniref:Rv1733c family protein n=1 Tax=Streptomyces sp. TRM 70361 TaxID=3116553 RepID=UPI002E7AB15C|nr:hypothetical protein [Streptomyces sp. TRM 70361]MEE1940781.1 hypothetical protein [Streptomyces sp. TRM 70361]